MTTRTFNAQSTQFVLDNTTENFIRYNVFPTTDISYDFGTRNGTVIIHNTSTQHMLGDIKSGEVSQFTKSNGYWFKNILIEGYKYQVITLTVANNAVAVNTQYDDDSNIVWINNTSTNQQHQFELRPPTKMNQKLLVYHNYTGTNADAISNTRVNFGIVERCVEGVFNYASTSDGTAGASTKIVNTLTTALNANNKYVNIQGQRFISFIGMKNPISNVLFWIVEDSTSRSLN
jgi:hypothetical protein|tara:strand:+ start:222 stop:917 length:696 start_codon:yes stop_codon:yes gene_type:complete